MSDATTQADVLDTTGGEFRLQEYLLRQGGRQWTVLHTGTVLTFADEQRVIGAKDNRLPYGVALWPSAIALAHEIATRPKEFSGRRVLELGAGTGLPGIVAASFAAQVVQTDGDELALHLCKRNGARNGVDEIEHRLADWTTWDVIERYNWIIGSDILYGEPLHPHLRLVFESNLAAGGRVLLSDPLRSTSLRLMETMEAAGWGVSFNRWDLGEEGNPRPVGVFELVPPRAGGDASTGLSRVSG